MLLHRETVHREMPGVERKCQIEVPSPVATQRLGDREDQIDREIRYPLAANNFDSGQYLSSIMRPMHPRQHRVVERLHPQRNPIHARLDPRPDDGNRDVLRVRLNGDLAKFGCGDVGYCGNQFCDFAYSNSELGGSSSPEIERTNRADCWAYSAGCYFCRNGVNELNDRNLASNGDGKVAVGTAPSTEGHVDVDVTWARNEVG